jgi:electron transfer flavoprotein alpha/beta subunit
MVMPQHWCDMANEEEEFEAVPPRGRRQRKRRSPAELSVCKQVLQPLAVANRPAKVVEKENPNVVPFGKQATGGDSGQAGPVFADVLGWPQAGGASKIEADEGKAVVTESCLVDAGIHETKCSLTDAGCEGAMLADVLGWPQACRAFMIVVDDEGKAVMTETREVDWGFQKAKCSQFVAIADLCLKIEADG